MLVALAISLGVGKKAAQAQTLFGLAHSGPNGLRPSILYKINPDTGAAAEVGPTGFERCSGRDFSPLGTLYATCFSSSGAHVLITIDTTTGAGMEIGTGTGVGADPSACVSPFPSPLNCFTTVSDISFRNSEGALFAYLRGTVFLDSLATIDIATGTATLKEFPTVTFGIGNGIAFSPGDELFHADEFLLNTLNQGSGTVVPGGVPLMFPAIECPNQFPPNFDCRVNAMDFDPLTEMLFASVNHKVGSVVENFLATIETKGGTKGDVTIIDPTVDGMDAIAFAPAAEVPFDVFEIKKARVRWHEEANEYRFEVRGRIELGESDEIDVLNEGVTVTFGDGFSEMIPGAEFVRDDDDGKEEEFEFEGASGGITNIKIEIEEDGEEDAVIEFEVKARGLALGSLTNPVSFSLQIGNDIGETGIWFDDEGRFRE